MKVLSIGNSFSQDAQRYLHGIARADHTEMRAVNLYIGGCSLEQHAQNLHDDAKAYSLELNGETSGFSVSIREALCSQAWDAVTIQQASHFSTKYATVQPFAGELAKEIRSLCPGARLLVHETWAYEEGSERLTQMMGYRKAEDMFHDLHAVYRRMAREVSADGIIPAGTLLFDLAGKIGKVHRDTFHASLGAGRAALGLLWYHRLTGRPIGKNPFRDFDEPVTERERSLIVQAVNALDEMEIMNKM